MNWTRQSRIKSATRDSTRVTARSPFVFASKQKTRGETET
jgi:hypothetical protein